MASESARMRWSANPKVVTSVYQQIVYNMYKKKMKYIYIYIYRERERRYVIVAIILYLTRFLDYLIYCI